MPNRYIPLGKRITWEGFKTPLNDANLNNIEARIQAISDYLDNIQNSGMILGKGTILGNSSKAISEDTYLTIRDSDDIDIAEFTSDYIRLFHNASTQKSLIDVNLNDNVFNINGTLKLKNTSLNEETLSRIINIPLSKGSCTDSLQQEASNATNSYAFASGQGTIASGKWSHTEGGWTEATGETAHAEGWKCRAIAKHSHAGGQNTTASGFASFTANNGTLASGCASAAFGNQTEATGYSQFVAGAFNKKDANAMFIIGGGTSDSNRLNAFTVDKNGNGWFAGSLTLGETVVTEETLEQSHQALEKLVYIPQYFANALKGKAEGEAVVMNDISPLEHEIKVSVRGKNLYNPATVGVVNATINGGSAVLNSNTAHIDIPIMKAGTYTLSCNYDSTIYIRNGRVDSGTIGNTSNGTFTFNFANPVDGYVRLTFFNGSGKTVGNIQIEEGATATSYASYISDISAVTVNRLGKNLLNGELQVGIYNDNTCVPSTGYNDDLYRSFSVYLPKGTYTLSSDTPLYLLRSIIDNTYSATAHSGIISYTFTVSEAGLVGFTVRREDGTAWDNATRLQIEVGNTASDYEPYVESVVYPVGADGTVEGVTSLYPTTTLIADTAEAVINAEYNRDLNKVFIDLIGRNTLTLDDTTLTEEYLKLLLSMWNVNYDAYNNNNAITLGTMETINLYTDYKDIVITRDGDDQLTIGMNKNEWRAAYDEILLTIGYNGDGLRIGDGAITIITSQGADEHTITAYHAAQLINLFDGLDYNGLSADDVVNMVYEWKQDQQ